MNPKANPVCRPGERNIDCPYYEMCLDYTADSNWEFWDCSCCAHKTACCPLSGKEGTTVKYEIAYYDVILEKREKLEMGY